MHFPAWAFLEFNMSQAVPGKPGSLVLLPSSKTSSLLPAPCDSFGEFAM